MKLSKRPVLALLSTSALALLLTACGGGTNKPLATITVVPALGKTYGANVQLIDTSGNVIASGVTGSKGSSNEGIAQLPIYNAINSPVVTLVNLTTSSSYFDEKSGTDKTVTAPATLMSMTPSLTTNTSVGVTPLTNMAATLAGVSPTTGKATTALTTDTIATSVVKTNLILGLPPTYNILQTPTNVAYSPTTIPTTGYSALVAQISQIFDDALNSTNNLVSIVSSSGTVSNPTTLQTINTALQSNPVVTQVVTVTVPVTDTTALNTAAAASKEAVKTAITTPSGTGASN